MKILITGGAGFIGSALIRFLLDAGNVEVINLDKLTYAGNLESLAEAASNPNYHFEQVDICDAVELDRVFAQYAPQLVMHLAAESHVDRSTKDNFRFHHISTDEVYGDLEGPEDLFTEETSYAPSSPYSASKAASDHLVRAWHRTYNFPVIVTNCSNNYGPYQFPEKLIPVIILNALEGKPLPIYGNGKQIRDWLYVDDHARALYHVAVNGKLGETYNIGGHNEKQNLEVVHTICSIMEELVPEKPAGIERYVDLITYVKDRPGHDVRYAIDASKIEQELGWVPQETFETGLRKTVEWYLQNKSWWMNVKDGSYQPKHAK